MSPTTFHKGMTSSCRYLLDIFNLMTNEKINILVRGLPKMYRSQLLNMQAQFCPSELAHYNSHDITGFSFL